MAKTMVAFSRCWMLCATVFDGLLREAEHSFIVASETSLACQSAGAFGKADLIAASALVGSMVGDCWAEAVAAVSTEMMTSEIIRMARILDLALQPWRGDLATLGFIYEIGDECDARV